MNTLRLPLISLLGLAACGAPPLKLDEAATAYQAYKHASHLYQGRQGDEHRVACVDRGHISGYTPTLEAQRLSEHGLLQYTLEECQVDGIVLHGDITTTRSAAEKDTGAVWRFDKKGHLELEGAVNGACEVERVDHLSYNKAGDEAPNTVVDRFCGFDVSELERAHTEKLQRDAKDAAHKAGAEAEQAKDRAVDESKEAAATVRDGANDAAQQAKDSAEKATQKAKDRASEATQQAKDQAGRAQDATSNAAQQAQDAARDAAQQAKDRATQAKDSVRDAATEAKDSASAKAQQVKDQANAATQQAKEKAEQADQKAADLAHDAKVRAGNVTSTVSAKAYDAVQVAKGTAVWAAQGARDAAVAVKDKTVQGARATGSWVSRTAGRLWPSRRPVAR